MNPGTNLQPQLAKPIHRLRLWPRLGRRIGSRWQTAWQHGEPVPVLLPSRIVGALVVHHVPPFRDLGYLDYPILWPQGSATNCRINVGSAALPVAKTTDLGIVAVPETTAARTMASSKSR